MKMYTEKDGIGYLSSERIAASGGVVHGFLARKGGASPAPFASLNFDTRSGDVADNVEQNIERVAAVFGFDPTHLSLPMQVHGTEVVAADGPLGYMAVEADAVATATPGLPIGVLTADCLPILLFDPVSRAAAVAHAGWRGTASGVAGAAVAAMRSFGARPEKIVASLGAHIRPCCYTCGEEVRDAFVATFGSDWPGLWSFEDQAGALTLDMASANRAVLTDSGVLEGNIDNTYVCTSCRTDLFFSHRRECAGTGTHTGRQLSFIMLRG